MVGLVKQIVDGVGERDIRRADPTQPSQRLFVERVMIRHGMAFVFKDRDAT